MLKGLLQLEWLVFFFLILPPSLFFFIFLVYSRNLQMESMAIEDTLHVIESILDEKDLARIQEEFNIPVSIRHMLPSPFKRVVTRLATRVALYEDAFKARLRLPLPTITVELLQWYQMCPMQLNPNAWYLIIGLFSTWCSMERCLMPWSLGLSFS